jgi:hypothetical protein
MPMAFHMLTRSNETPASWKNHIAKVKRFAPNIVFYFLLGDLLNSKNLP